MKKIEIYNEQTFEGIKHIENGIELWYARELMTVLEYKQWRNFKAIINKAIVSCINSNNNISEHFANISKTIKMPNNASKEVEDYKLTRYACYLIVQNGDPRKKAIALGQTYFAIQTRKQELTEQEYKSLSEDEKRMYNRKITKNKNKILYEVAMESGVTNYGKFTNFGYMGLYKGETAKDIKRRKGLSEKDDILDYMGNEELGANIFRITQTEAKLKKDNVKDEITANITHYEVGKAVRNTIKDLGGTMPEKLPTPNKSIKQIEKEKEKKLLDKK